MKLLARAALALAALIAIVLALVDPRSSEADHLCGATGSPYGPFNIETYEAGNYRTLYGETLNLVGTNQLFPSLPSFAIPSLDSGVRGSTTQVSPHIPPVLLKAIASIESNWAQADYSVPYGSVGPVLSSHDCGYGIMQITSGMQNIAGSPNLDQAMIGGHFAFNMARGGHILADKWNMAPEFRPQVGNADPRVIENWYFALWGYNGFAFQNHPLNPAFSPTRVDYSCGPFDDGFGHDRTRYPYQELVYGCAEHPPARGGQLLWPSQAVHMPDLSDPRFAEPLSVDNWTPCSQYLDCGAMDIPTPNTNHTDSTLTTATRSEVIGTPRMEVSTSSVTLARDGRAAVTVSNSGSGLLAYRVRSTSPLIRISRYQGVSLGSDLGTRSSSFVLSANTSALAAGTYTGNVVIESLYAANAPKTISVKIINLPSGSLVAGSGPEVYAMKSGLRRWVPNPATLEANGYSWSDIEKVPDTFLNTIPLGNPLFNVLSDANLLAAGGSAVYVMEGGEKRHVTSRAAMSECGYSFKDIRSLSSGRLSKIPTGAPLSGAPCPVPALVTGSMVKGSGPAIYVISRGLKRHIPDAASLEGLGYHWGNVDKIGDSMMNALPTGHPLLSVLSDASLLTADGPEVYVMEGGQKRHVTSRAVMSECGYLFEDLRRLSSGRLGGIPTGAPVTGAPCPRPAIEDGRLISGPDDDAVYVMKRGLKRHIPDGASFEGLGYIWGNGDEVGLSMMNAIPTGKPLLSVLADGNVLRGSSDVLFIMHAGTRRVVSLSVLTQCGYGEDAVRTISDHRLSAVPAGVDLGAPPCPAIVIPNGALVSAGGPEIYVVENGAKRHITSRAAFNACGYQWGDIDRLPASMAGLMPLGSSVDGTKCP